MDDFVTLTEKKIGVPIFFGNVPELSRVSRKNCQVSRFPEISPDSRNNFSYVPKQRLLELSPPVTNHHLVVRFGARFGRFVAIHAQYEEDCKKISFDKQAHFENLR